MKRSSGTAERWFYVTNTMAPLAGSSAERPAHHSAGSSAKRPAHRSSNVQSTMAPLATHNLSRSAQQLAVLQCLEREGWLVTPLLNGCRVAVLSKACKQALEGWPNRLESLKFLELCRRDLVARKLQWVAQHCPQLRYLVLTSTTATALNYSSQPSTTATDGGNLTEAIQAVARGCSQLRHLDFDGNFVSDVAIEAIAQSCHQLQCLYLSDCDVTDAALLAVAQGCPKLKELDVSLNFISNAAIQAVAQAYPQLKKLNVASCADLRDEAIDSVARGCPQLECLDVSGLQFITDAAIHAVSQGCPQLKQLGMIQCDRLTESAIWSIARGCTQLEWLKHSMAWCHGWSADLAIIDVGRLGPNAHVWRSDAGLTAIRWER